jgi:hypothetical protein
MKNLSILFFFIASTLQAQIEIKNQPHNWFEETWSLHQKKMISEENLLAMKKENFPINFQDTLRAYDWVDLGGYLYVDKHFTVSYNTKNPEYKIIRLDENDTNLYFSYNATYNEMEKGSVSHTNFRITLNMHPVWKVVKIKGNWFIEDTNNKEYLHLISYANGILVYDIPMNGKTSDTKMFARIVFMAREKTFNWSKTEN